MSKRSSSQHVIQAEAVPLSPYPVAARLVAIQDDGSLRVETPDGQQVDCDWLVSDLTRGVSLGAGDSVLLQPMQPGQRSVVLGRIGRYTPPAHLQIEATESLTLKCGEACVDLRADGAIMVRGEDVLLRAKGTQRIRAGTVSIN